MKKFYHDLIKDLENYNRIVVASVVRSQGSTPRTEGAKMIIYPDGKFKNTVGGGLFESIVINDALEVYKTGQSILKTYSFNQEGKYAIGAVCGGTAEIFIEMIKNTSNLFIIGGGHAGVEAALAISRMGKASAIVTMDAKKLALMSCNPAIGGIGKSHVVKEIDALGGIMGMAADASGIQFRRLNLSRGPAVWSTTRT